VTEQSPKIHEVLILVSYSQESEAENMAANKTPQPTAVPTLTQGINADSSLVFNYVTL
jgi:hypothetical protein